VNVGLSEARGYTLVEIVTSISLLAVLTTIAVPYMTSWVVESEKEGSLIAIESLFQSAAIQAKSSRQLVLVGKTDKSIEARYRSLDDLSGDVEAESCNTAVFDAATIVKEYRYSPLPKKLSYALVNDSVSVICFYSDGSSSGGYATVTKDGNVTRLIVSKLTAMVRRDTA